MGCEDRTKGPQTSQISPLLLGLSRDRTRPHWARAGITRRKRQEGVSDPHRRCLLGVGQTRLLAFLRPFSPTRCTFCPGSVFQHPRRVGTVAGVTVPYDKFWALRCLIIRVKRELKISFCPPRRPYFSGDRSEVGGPFVPTQPY
jgi:hypothetical protein